MAESGRAAWACWDQRYEVASAESTLLGGATLSYSCGLSFLRERGLGPPLQVGPWPHWVAGGYNYSAPIAFEVDYMLHSLYSLI